MGDNFGTAQWVADYRPADIFLLEAMFLFRACVSLVWTAHTSREKKQAENKSDN